MHIMIDLETLGTRKDASIVQIGAVMFEPHDGGKVLNGKAFNCYVTPEGSIDPATIFWWLVQPDAARRRLVEGMKRAQPEAVALASFAQWPMVTEGLSWGAIDGVWSHGATFDIPIMESAFTRKGHAIPWGYRTARDTRTLFDLVGGAPPVDATGLVLHDAKDDAILQAMQVQKALARLTKR